jgi:C4-type Zn-finger protein
MIYQHGGWHFSSLGNTDHVANKLRNFTDYAFEDAANLDIEELIKKNVSQVNKNSKFQPVVLDDYFPKSLIENKEKYKHLIIEDATQSITDLLND